MLLRCIISSGITFREVPGTGQFVGNFLHHRGYVILSDDGLVQWYTIQARPYFAGWLHWICGTVYPWCWFWPFVQAACWGLS